MASHRSSARNPAADAALLAGHEGRRPVLRLLLVILVLVIGYDAIVHQGAYTREAWTSIVRLTDSSVEGARGLGERARNDIRS